MAWTAANPTVIGNATKKTDYDKLWDNALFLHERRVVQVVQDETVTAATGTTAIPYDDTIPQKTEGDEYLTRTITPAVATNILKIDVQIPISASAAGTLAVALFKDAVDNALNAIAKYVANDSITVPQFLFLTHIMAAGTTSQITFKIRAGSSTGNIITVNGAAGDRKYGGVLTTLITIIEFGAV